jgi:2-C-methyl-D-erythritol 4-phosphate cytidylyltransferase
LIDALFAVAAQRGAVIPAIPVADTLKQVSQDRIITGTTPRENLWQAQTPQVFRKDWLLDAYTRRAEFGAEVTDDAQLVEAAGHQVHVIDGDPGNIKITTRSDIFLADAILKSRPKPKPKGPAHPFADEDMWR